MKVWWWAQEQNFGDALGPAILERLGHKVEWAGLHEADLITVGSIIEMAQGQARDGLAVWGSGLMGCEPRQDRDFAYLAVRGGLTAQTLGVDVPTGDPGCLVPLLWPRALRKHRFGVVPHYADTNLYPWADIRIDVRAPVDVVIEQITSCERIASSSLHGLIVAHAFGIPALRLPHPNVGGGDFKWLDWLSGMDDLGATQDRLLVALKGFAE